MSWPSAAVRSRARCAIWSRARGCLNFEEFIATDRTHARAPRIGIRTNVFPLPLSLWDRSTSWKRRPRACIHLQYFSPTLLSCNVTNFLNIYARVRIYMYIHTRELKKKKKKKTCPFSVASLQRNERRKRVKSKRKELLLNKAVRCIFYDALPLISEEERAAASHRNIRLSKSAAARGAIV